MKACGAWTVALEDAPDQPLEIELTYERGDPIALTQTADAGCHAGRATVWAVCTVGRSDIVETCFVGMKPRVAVMKHPGGTILLKRSSRHGVADAGS